MPPPPAEPFAARIFLGPALRAQPDRRLVKLVREGYESAFEEIVRRYRRQLERFAAAIVGGRSEDVTQDAFSKALLALRGTTTEIELRPWLYRIVRNTALNEIRDAPPATLELGETLPGGESAAVVAERREEIGELMERLRALPEPQRAAIVMRELEGLSHEEIAAALGVSGGAARQAIYRARLALRDGFGLLIPLPLLRMLFDHGAEAAGAGAGGAVAAAGAASAAGGGSGATLGGIGAAGALKVGLASAVLAGSVGAGVAMQHDRGGRGPDPAAAAVTQAPSGDGLTPGEAPGSSGATRSSDPGEDRGGGRSGADGEKRDGDDDRHGHGGGERDDSPQSDSPGSDGPSEHHGPSGHGGRGPGHGGSGDGAELDGDASGGSHSGRHGSGGSGNSGPGGGGSSGGSGSGHGGGSGSSGGGDDSGSGSGSGGSGDDGSGRGGESGSGAGPSPAPVTGTAPVPEPAVDSGDGSGESGSGTGADPAQARPTPVAVRAVRDLRLRLGLWG